jgi:hypothetical protein
MKLDDLNAQFITVDTPGGPQPLLAPDGWEFDRTAKKCWSRLLYVAGESLKPQKRVRDKHVLDGQVEVLAIVLANSLGMASFFWQQEAKRLTVIDQREIKS